MVRDPIGRYSDGGHDGDRHLHPRAGKLHSHIRRQRPRIRLRIAGICHLTIRHDHRGRIGSSRTPGIVPPGCAIPRSRTGDPGNILRLRLLVRYPGIRHRGRDHNRQFHQARQLQCHIRGQQCGVRQRAVRFAMDLGGIGADGRWQHHIIRQQCEAEHRDSIIGHGRILLLLRKLDGSSPADHRGCHHNRAVRPRRQDERGRAVKRGHKHRCIIDVQRGDGAPSDRLRRLDLPRQRTPQRDRPRRSHGRPLLSRMVG